jgi:hypothetical protein
MVGMSTFTRESLARGLYCTLVVTALYCQSDQDVSTVLYCQVEAQEVLGG